MKGNYRNLLVLILTVFIASACQDDPTLTVLEKVSFSAIPTSNATEIVVTEENVDDKLITFTWGAVKYPISAPVTYSLEFAVPQDTLNGWKNTVEREIGEEVFTAQVSGQELNAIASELGLEPGERHNVVVRIKSYLDRPAFSKALAISLTPLKVFSGYPALWIAGDFQGWNIGAAATIVSVNDDGIYEGYIYLPPGGTNEFKLYAQPNWEPTSYGNGGDDNMIVANYAGANFAAPSDGYYLFSVNLNTMKYLLIKTEWGIIGGATPAGWDADTPLVYNPATQKWSVTAEMKADGSFKFRANNAWQLDFGKDESGNPGYANHPWKAYIEQPHFTVPSDGNYTVTLDLSEPGNYKYSIKKN